MSTASSRRAALLGAVALGVAAAALGLRTMGPSSGPGPGLDFAEITAAPEATPDRAAEVMERLQDFRRGRAGLRLSLGSDDVTALVRHGLPGVLPAGISDPVVTFRGDRLHVVARLATSDFVGRAPLATVLGALPDTITVDVVGRLVSRQGYLRLQVLEAHAGRVPLPATAVAAIAADLTEPAGARWASDGGPPSLGIRRPAGFTGVEVAEGRLVLRRDEPLIDRAVDGSDDP